MDRQRLFALLSGVLYPEVKLWSCLAVGSCTLHIALALIVAGGRLMNAAKTTAWFWQGLSAVMMAGLLLAYVLRRESGWLLAAAGLALFTIVVTTVFCLVLRGNGVGDAR